MSDTIKNLTRKWLEAKGWHTWYNENYWVNKKVVSDPTAQDYTNYGMSMDDAVAFEKKGKKPFSSTPLAGLFGSGARQNKRQCRIKKL